MRFEWDEQKSRRNRAKHKVSFERACRVFDDPHHVSLRDDRTGEERWLTFGMIDGVVVLVVAHTLEEHADEEVLRIISARKATRHERARYENPSQET